MSQETLTTLNQSTLIGFTDKRGHAWHYKASEQGAEPNHYPGAIPIEDVRRRLFDWEAVEAQITATALLPDGVLTSPSNPYKAILRSDTGAILGIFKEGYQIHQYDEWLLEQVENLLDDSLSIGSAGVLRGGALAWVSIEVPENITTPEGVVFRPNLLSTTSMDGSLATTLKRVVTNVVCDNTHAAGLAEVGQQVKIRHSRYSTLRLQDARDALALIHTAADDFAAEVAELCNTTVTDDQWRAFQDSLIEVPEKDGRSKTIALNKRAALTRLWENDIRVAPWKNTAWGVLQAVNTATHHEWGANGTRVERNQLRAIQGGVDKLDAGTLGTLTPVLTGGAA